MKKIAAILVGWTCLTNAHWSLGAEQAEPDKSESPIKVNVMGAPEILSNNLKAHLPSLRNLACDSSSERVERFIEASGDKLIEGADAVGYFSATFQTKATREQDCWVLNITVKPGETVKVRQQDIQLSGAGEPMPEFRKIMAELPYKSGDVLVTSGYENFKSRLKSTAGRLGFFDAQFVKRQIAVNINAGVADIILYFDTGKRYQIGEVKVEQDVLSDRHLNRYLRLKEGETYDSDTLLAQRRILEGSGYYQDVQVSSRFSDAKDNKVPVEINALRRKRYTYTANIGYATDTDVRLEAGMETHWVNSSGHKLDGKLRLSNNDSGLAFNYKVPLWQPEHEYASVSADWSSTDNTDIKSEKLELEFNYNRITDTDWQQTAFISFLNEETQVANELPVNSQLTLFGARLNKTERDHSLFPTKGWRLRAEVQGAHKGVFSDLSLLQGSVEGKYLYTFEHKGKLLLRGELGSSWTDDFAELPKSLRFFAGGQSSVRGYDFESIGEVNAEGSVVGGQHKIVSIAEYEYPVTEKIGLAAFVDAGSVFDQWNDQSFAVGYGLGVRYKSPLGPVRVDLAVPKSDSSDVHFYFSLGPDL